MMGYDGGYDGFMILVGSGQSGDRQSHFLHPLQVPLITAKPQNKCIKQRDPYLS